MEEVRERFRAADLDEMLAILRKNANRSTALKEEMTGVLKKLTAE